MIDRARLERRTTELSRIAGRGPSVSRLGLSSDEQQARELVGGEIRREHARQKPPAMAEALDEARPAVAVGDGIAGIDQRLRVVDDQRALADYYEACAAKVECS